jgi:hypothetical protein
MADNKMNAAYWSTNKAKTLLDSGDTVRRALERWDGFKKKNGIDVIFSEVNDALAKLSKAAGDLKGKASKLLHKQTIDLLDQYIKNCQLGLKKINDSTNEGMTLLSAAKNKGIPKMVNAIIQKVDPATWGVLEENYFFLKAMQATGNKGNPKIVDTFIKPGQKMTINIPGQLRTMLLELAQNQVWDHDLWRGCVKEIDRLLGENLKNKNVVAGFVKAAQLNHFDALKGL